MYPVRRHTGAETWTRSCSNGSTPVGHDIGVTGHIQRHKTGHWDIQPKPEQLRLRLNLNRSDVFPLHVLDMRTQERGGIDYRFYVSQSLDAD
jgi:hypothetical protein